MNPQEIDNMKIPWYCVGIINKIYDLRTYESRVWIKKNTYKAVKYTRHEFRCSSFHANRCQAKLKAHEIHETKKLILYRAFEHDAECTSFVATPVSIKDMVFELHDSGKTKPAYIHMELRKKGINITARKISQIIYSAKHKLPIPTIDNIFLEINRLKSQNPKLMITKEVCNGKPRILISNEILLLNCKDAQNFHVDGTYRLIDIGYPVIILGVTDNNGSFYLMGIGICEDESATSYVWCVNVIKRNYNKLNSVFNPANIVADAAPQITKMQEECFPEALRTTCWAHVWRNINKKISSVSKNFRSEIVEDLKFLQLASSEKLFKLSTYLFELKWRNFDCIKTFIHALKKNYFAEKNSSWYEGYFVFGPSSNNALERFNRTLKDSYVNWQRNGLLKFIRVATDIVNDRAEIIKENNNLRRFSTVEYFDSEVMCNENFSFEIIEQNSDFIKYLVTKEEDPITEKTNVIELIKSGNFTYFSQMKEIFTRFAVLMVNKEILTYKDISCTCKDFMKRRKCKHVFKYLCINEKTDIIDFLVIKAKKLRGRPKKIPKGCSLSK